MHNKKLNPTLKLVYLAMLMALAIIFTRFLSYNGPVLRIGIGRLPIFAASLWFGPLAGVLVAGGADLIGAATTTGFDWIIMIPALLAGLLPGLLVKVFRLEKRHRSKWVCLRMILCITVTHLLTSGILMTFILHYVTKQPLYFLFATRPAIALVEGVLQGYLLYLIETRLRHEN
ncbi:MAG: folate family ECF transporter S component [Clostridia bacterium]|nr:folate family ECF transporter S component [Clostridia bacterium]